MQRRERERERDGDRDEDDSMHEKYFMNPVAIRSVESTPQTRRWGLLQILGDANQIVFMHIPGLNVYHIYYYYFLVCIFCHEGFWNECLAVVLLGSKSCINQTFEWWTLK